MPPQWAQQEEPWRNPDPQSQGRAQEEFKNIISALISAFTGVAPGERDPLFGGGSPRPGAGDLIPGLKPAAVTVAGLAKSIPRYFHGPAYLPLPIINMLKEVQRRPQLADELNYAWRNVGHSGKIVDPEYLGSGVEASAFAVRPFKKGGEVLKIIERPADRNTMFGNQPLFEAVEKAPKDLLLPVRLKGAIGSSGSYVTQPIAQTLAEWQARLQESGVPWREAYRRVQNLETIIHFLGNKHGYELGSDVGAMNVGLFRRKPYIIDVGTLGSKIHNIIEADNPRLLGRANVPEPFQANPDSDALARVVEQFGSKKALEMLVGKTKANEIRQEAPPAAIPKKIHGTNTFAEWDAFINKMSELMPQLKKSGNAHKQAWAEFQKVLGDLAKFHKDKGIKD